MINKSDASKQMTDNPNQDLSMEEILASIRRIVTEDQPTDVAAASHAPAENNIYDLTQLVSDEGHITDVRLVQSVPPHEASAASRSAAAPGPQSFTSAKTADTVAQQLLKLNQAQHEHQLETLVNELRQETTLESLIRDMVKPFIMNWLENNYEPLVVKMLKKWLEKNLPDLVERVVNEEIHKLTHPADER